jgi:hypothetical protein
MTKREILREQYEDALFALLMDDVALATGKTAVLEKEWLKGSSDFVISEEADKRCEKSIANHYRRQTARTAGKVFSRIVGKVAVVALSAMLLFTTVFAVSPVFRAHTLNLVMETFYDRTNFQFTTEGPVEKSRSDALAGWLPEGYALVSETEDSMSRRMTYSSDTGGEINVALFNGSGLLSIDTEDASVKNISLHGTSAMVSEKEGVIQITWANENINTFINVQGISVSGVELIKFAENLNLE